MADTAAGDQQLGVTLGYMSVREAVGDRVQRLNPLWRIVREFLFEGDMSYVAMGTLGMISALCELQLRPEERATLSQKSIKLLNRMGRQEE